MRKTQIGWVFIIIIGGIFAVLPFIKSGGAAFAFTTQILLGIILFLFYRLTIIVDDEFVQFIFGIGLIRGKYKLSEITQCRPVRYFSFGWGIRLRPGVILFNVSGNKAIELVIKGKRRKVRIGTDSPEEISEYIQEKITKGVL